MIIFDEIIENKSGLYIIFQKDDMGGVESLLTRLVIPEEDTALFKDWSKIFNGEITTYGLNFNTGSIPLSDLQVNVGVDGESNITEIPQLLTAIDWEKVVTVKHLDHTHALLYEMLIEAGTTITVPKEPVMCPTCEVLVIPTDTNTCPNCDNTLEQ